MPLDYSNNFLTQGDLFWGLAVECAFFLLINRRPKQPQGQNELCLGAEYQIEARERAVPKVGGSQ